MVFLPTPMFGLRGWDRERRRTAFSPPTVPRRETRAAAPAERRELLLPPSRPPLSPVDAVDSVDDEEVRRSWQCCQSSSTTAAMPEIGARVPARPWQRQGKAVLHP